MATGLSLAGILLLLHHARAAPGTAVGNITATSLCGSVPVVPVGWFAGRDMGPPSLHKLSELESFGVYVAPVLYGGLGNQLFQLAALHVYARSVK